MTTVLTKNMRTSGRLSWFCRSKIQDQKHIMTHVEYLANNTTHTTQYYLIPSSAITLRNGVVKCFSAWYHSIYHFTTFHFNFFSCLPSPLVCAHHNRLGRRWLGRLEWLDTVLDDMRWRHQEPLPRLRFAATEVWRQVLWGKYTSSYINKYI